jgi:hypothetical protein
MDLKFHPFSEKNRFGYYSAGDYCTYSKVDAIEVGKRLNQPVVWHFNDEVFDNLDWHKDPDMSLWDLYTARARQIREKYDYLVLFYSGGADSNNILNSFVLNNIHLDEVIQYTNYDVTKDKSNVWNAELFEVAVPTTVKMINDYKLKTRHRLVDLSQIVTNLDKISPDLDDWIYGKNSYYSPNMRATSYIRSHTPEYQDLIAKGKSVCFVWGCEKPMLVNTVDPADPTKYTVSSIFQDRVDHCISVKDQVENFPWIHDELFYWSPDAPLIAVKQAHTVAKFFESATANSAFLTKQKMAWGNTVINGETFFLTANGLNQLIYPYWDPDTFSIGKNPSIVLSPRDHWMLQDKNAIHKMQFETIRQLQKKVKEQWTGLKWGIQHYHSPAYALKPMPATAIPLGPYNDHKIKTVRPRIITKNQPLV